MPSNHELVTFVVKIKKLLSASRRYTKNHKTESNCKMKKVAPTADFAAGYLPNSRGETYMDITARKKKEEMNLIVNWNNQYLFSIVVT